MSIEVVNAGAAWGASRLAIFGYAGSLGVLNFHFTWRVSRYPHKGTNHAPRKFRARLCPEPLFLRLDGCCYLQSALVLPHDRAVPRDLHHRSLQADSFSCIFRARLRPSMLGCRFHYCFARNQLSVSASDEEIYFKKKNGSLVQFFELVSYVQTTWSERNNANNANYTYLRFDADFSHPERISFTRGKKFERF